MSWYTYCDTSLCFHVTLVVFVVYARMVNIPLTINIHIFASMRPNQVILVSSEIEKNV